MRKGSIFTPMPTATSIAIGAMITAAAVLLTTPDKTIVAVSIISNVRARDPWAPIEFMASAIVKEPPVLTKAPSIGIIAASNTITGQLTLSYASLKLTPPTRIIRNAALTNAIWIEMTFVAVSIIATRNIVITKGVFCLGRLSRMSLPTNGRTPIDLRPSLTDPGRPCTSNTSPIASLKLLSRSRICSPCLDTANRLIPYLFSISIPDGVLPSSSEFGAITASDVVKSPLLLDQVTEPSPPAIWKPVTDKSSCRSSGSASIIKISPASMVCKVEGAS